MHAHFTECGNGIEVFAGDEHEADSRDERVDFVDHDSLPAAEETADLRVIPSKSLLHVLAFWAVQSMAKRRLDKGRVSHDSMPHNGICVRLRTRVGNFGLIPLNPFEVDQPRDTGRGAILGCGQLFECAAFIRHEPHVHGLVGQHTARRARNGSFLAKHGGILPFVNLAQTHDMRSFGLMSTNFKFK